MPRVAHGDRPPRGAELERLCQSLLLHLRRHDRRQGEHVVFYLVPKYDAGVWIPDVESPLVEDLVGPVIHLLFVLSSRDPNRPAWRRSGNPSAHER